LRQRARHRRDEYGHTQEHSNYRMPKALSYCACVAPDPKRHRRVQLKPIVLRKMTFSPPDGPSRGPEQNVTTGAHLGWLVSKGFQWKRRGRQISAYGCRGKLDISQRLPNKFLSYHLSIETRPPGVKTDQPFTP
jgi:hypothetical protein